jgi:predicted TIM-barrel fold metal-dependent hydrolase
MGEGLEAMAKEVGITNLDNLADGSLERLLQDMDEAGIDKTVILPLDRGFLYPEGGFTFRDHNDLAGRYLKEAPDRIIAFAGVDPRRGPSGVEELKRCVEEMGFTGLKLWTVAGFAPDDIAYYPLYETAAELGVNVLVHTGMGPSDTYLGPCQPVRVDRMAVDFREINFIMAHAGNPWVDEALTVALKNPNVYLDLSAWQPTALLFPFGLAQLLSRAKLMHMGVSKVLFGSDWPLFSEICPQKAWVNTIRDLSHPAPLQAIGLPALTEEDKERILGRNAQRALKL